jgi:hypothetical protein
MLMRVSRLAVAMGILIACGAASSAEHAGRATRDQSAEMEKFYTGGRTKTGEFTDKLVWLCTDRVQGQPAPSRTARAKDIDTRSPCPAGRWSIRCSPAPSRSTSS